MKPVFLQRTWDDCLDVPHKIKVGLSRVAAKDKRLHLTTTELLWRVTYFAEKKKKQSAVLPTAHCFQDLAASTLGWKVDLLTNILSLRNQMQNLQTPAHRAGQAGSTSPI